MKAEEQRAAYTATQATSPTEWPIVPFEQVATPQSDRGKRIKQRDYLPEGRIPVIDQGQTLIGGYTNDEDFAFLGELPVVLFGDHTRAVKLIDHRFAVGADGIKIFRPAEGVRPKYLYYWMKSARIPDRGYGRHYQYLRQLSVPLPPPHKQDEIVAEIEKQFSRLDEAVANLKRVKAKLKRYKAAVLRAAVEGKFTEAWRNQHPNTEPASELLQRILAERRAKWEQAEFAKMQAKGKTPKDDAWKKKYPESAALDTSDLPELPAGWGWARLDAIAALKGGITVDSKRKDLTARSVPYLRVANVQRGYIDLAEVKYIEAPESEIEALRLLRGDILFNEGGDRDKLGRGWIWESQLADCIHQNHVFRARLYLDQLSPKLVSWWGNSFGKDYFSREGKQTTNLASINLTKLSAFPVPIPPTAEQQEVVAEVDRRLSIADEAEVQVNTNLQRAARLRSAVLSKSFLKGI